MTIFICDGKNILMDKITTHTHDFSHLPEEFHYKNNTPDDTYHERICKLNGILNPTKVKFWGEEVIAWTIVGVHNDQVSNYLISDIYDLDFRDVVYTSNTFGTSSILGNETEYIFLTKDGLVNQVTWCKEKCSYLSTETKLSALGTSDYGCMVIGSGSAYLDGFQMVALDGKLKAIELMVLAQGMYPGLGCRFDHYHIPTGKLSLDLDLSVRQRRLIAERIKSKISLPYVMEN